MQPLNMLPSSKSIFNPNSDPTIRRVWIVLFIAVLISGGVLFGTGYRHGLPFIDFPDEMTIWTMGRSYVDPSWGMFQPEYPPGVLVVSALIQRIEIATGGPAIDRSGTVAAMRILSVLLATLTLGLIMVLAYRYAGPMAGIIAGLCWLMLPIVNWQAKQATIDPWLWGLFMVSVVAGIEGWANKSVGWLVVSLTFGILSAIFKWQGAAAIGMAGLGCLTFWTVNKKRTIALMIAYCLIVGALGYWAVVIHHALAGGVYLPGTKTMIPTPAILWQNLQFQSFNLGPSLIFGLLPLMALLLALILPTARAHIYGKYAFWTLPIVIVVYNLVLSFNGAPVFERHYLAATALLCVMAGVGAVLMLQAVWQISRYLIIRRTFARMLLGMTGTLLLVILASTLGSPLIQTVSTSREMERPDIRVDFQQWASSTATAGPMIVTEADLDAAIQGFYGYIGRPIDTPYNQGTSVHLTAEALTDQIIAAKNIRYVVSWPGFLNAKNKALTLPMIHLLTINSDPDHRGTSWEVYYVGAIDNPHTATFGNEIVLRGFNLSKRVACQGDPISTQFFWGPAMQPTRYYSSYLHLSSDTIGEQSYPINGEMLSADRPTLSWRWPNETLVGPTDRWNIPTDFPPGAYHVWLGVFEPQSGQRLTVADGKDHEDIATIRVMDCQSTF